MLKVNNLSLSYGETKILRDVNFSCAENESIVITGCSGSGKSSLLHLLSGFQFDFAGEIFWAEQDISKLTTSKLLAWRRANLGFVFQSHYLLQDFSVLENVMLPMLITNCNPKQAQIEALDLLNKLSMQSNVNKPIHMLSGGERQRVAIARAIVHKPKLIMADEPTGALDPKLAETTIDLLMSLKDTASIIMVTHDLRLVPKFQRHFEIVDGVCIER